MTTLTLELPPYLYERLRQEATRQGKPEQEVAQELLAERLVPALDEAPPSYPELAPEVRAMLATMTDADLMVPPQGAVEDARALLRSWNEEDAVDPDDEGEPWEDVLRSLDRHRESYRKLFPELDQQLI